jgi:hypothetical protein
VLHRDRVSPGNIVRRYAQGIGQTVALRRTGCVVAAYDDLNEFRIQSRSCGELADTDSGRFHVVCYGFHYGCNLITFALLCNHRDLMVQDRFHLKYRPLLT